MSLVDVEMYEQRPWPRPLRAVVPAPVTDMRMVVALLDAGFGDFLVEHDWMLVGKSCARAVHQPWEIVHFAFPSYDKIYCRVKMIAKKVAALAQIVCFSTKRAREIGKLSPEWTQCLVPLVNSSKVKISGEARVPNNGAETDAGDIALC